MSRRDSVIAGTVVAALVLLAGLAVVAVHRPTWTARASVLVLPEAPGDQVDALAGLYDTLSRGQVAATYAELLRRPGRISAVLQGLPLTAQRRAEVAVEVEVVPDTSVLEITAQGPDRAIVEQVAEAMAQDGTSYLQRLSSPYTATTVGSAVGSAKAAALGRGALAGLVVLLALVAALVVQQLVQQLAPLLPLRGRSAAAPAAGSPAGLVQAPTRAAGRRLSRAGRSDGSG